MGKFASSINEEQCSDLYRTVHHISFIDDLGEKTNGLQEFSFTGTNSECGEFTSTWYQWKYVQQNKLKKQTPLIYWYLTYQGTCK